MDRPLWRIKSDTPVSEISLKVITHFYKSFGIYSLLIEIYMSNGTPGQSSSNGPNSMQFQNLVGNSAGAGGVRDSS